ncbi:MAG: HEAT repeat domain-containing protein, partial [Gemmatimonadetes bacterium]|nr:HEAT repeat domain-containing protein [Gemmatimonadota bacterium]
MNRVVSRGSWVLRVGALLALFLTAGLPDRLTAQTEAIVNRLAPILAAEDARDFQAGLLGGALADPDTLVRRTAIRALGRIGDPRAIPLLLPVLAQPDVADLHAEAAFALGLLRDSSAVGGLVARLRGATPLRPTAVDEAILALARIGGTEAALFLGQVLRDPTVAQADSGHRAYAAAVRESWRLGRLAPVGALVSAAGNIATTGPAIYGLGRLRAKEAGTLFLEDARATDAAIRQDAVRPLSKNYSQDAGLDRSAVISTLRRAIGDEDPGVQINALRALGTWGDSTLAVDVAPLLDDQFVNVQVTAATTLGQLG